MRADFDAQLIQKLQADAARDAQGGCEPAREMATARRVLRAFIFKLRRKVGMARPGDILKLIVVRRAVIRIADDGAKGAPQVALRRDLKEIRVFVLRRAVDQLLARRPPLINR